MSEVKLDSIIQFAVGKNATRLRDLPENELYSADDFERDLHCIYDDCKGNECVINLVKSKAAPLSEVNALKCITSNYIMCTFDTEVLDSWYFCYQFNAGQSIDQQIAMFHQGTTLCVKRLTVKSIGDLVIDLPRIEKQRIIGKMYKQFLIQNDLMNKQVENYKKMMLKTIRTIEED